MCGAERVRRWHGQALLFSVSRLTFRSKITGVQWPVLSQRTVTKNSVLSHFIAIFLIFHFGIEARGGLQLR